MSALMETDTCPHCGRVAEGINPVELIRRDILKAIRTGSLRVSKRDIRYIVDVYYQVQDFRVGAANQYRSKFQDEPGSMTDWAFKQFKVIEREIHKFLDSWTETTAVSRWAKSVFGVGPVIAAGLDAHIDMDIATTVGKIWRFSGNDPTIRWVGREESKDIIKDIVGKRSGGLTDEEVDMVIPELLKESGKSEQYFRDATNDAGQYTVESLARAKAVRPWNAKLKTLTWKIGQCFLKFSKREACKMGHLYRERKELEIGRNERGELKSEADRYLARKKIKSKDLRKTLESGKLSDGHIDARARRQVVKLFLSLWHEVAFEDHYGKPAPIPYVLAFKGHVDRIRPEDIGTRS